MSVLPALALQIGTWIIALGLSATVPLPYSDRGCFVWMLVLLMIGCSGSLISVSV